MKIALFTLSTLLVAHTTLYADVIASWDFKQSSNQLLDTSGTSDLTNLGGVTFSTNSGADFNSANISELNLAYNSALEPGSIGAGETWRLSLFGVKVDNAAGTRALYNSRDANGRGTIVYVNGGNFQFWTGNGSGTWNSIDTASVNTSSIYDLVASWDGTRMYFSVDDGATMNTYTNTPVSVGFNTGLSGTNSAIRFGNGGNTGTQYFFDGQIAGASIEIIPEPSTIALVVLAGFAACIVRRRRSYR